METAKVTDLKLPESKFLCKRGRCSIMNRIEDLVAALQKREEEKNKNTVLWILAIVGAVSVVAGIAYAVYRFFTPDYLEDFEDDFDDDFDDDFFEDEEEAPKKVEKAAEKKDEDEETEA